MLSRIEQLEENIATLEELQQRYTVEDIHKNRLDEWALRYGLFESIQIVIDVACHIASKYNLGSTKTYTECINKLHRHHYLDERLTKQLISAIGLRNMLIHEYVRIEIDKLYQFLELKGDFTAFIEALKPYL